MKPLVFLEMLTWNDLKSIWSIQDFNIIDGFSFGEQQADMGYARVPNGTGDFVIQSPTFSSNNNQESSQIELNQHPKKLLKVVDVLGRDVNKAQGGILLEIYNDNSIKKKLKIE